MVASISIFGSANSASAIWTITNDPTGGDCTKIGTWKGTTCSIGVNLTTGINITSNGITINGSGHSVTGNGNGDGVIMIGVSQVTIRDLDVSKFEDCVYIDNGANNQVTGSQLHLCTGTGITMINQANVNQVKNNEIHHNDQWGVMINEADSNVVDTNNIHDNGGGPGPGNGGVDVINSAKLNTMINNQIQNNLGFGIEFSQSAKTNTADKNQISNPQASWGIRIDDSNENLVIFNTISKEQRDGVLVQNGNTNKIICNDLSSHGQALGVEISPGTGNQVIMNNFLETDDADSTPPPGTNTFSYDKPIGGNYWDIYSPTCATDDGMFCNKPHAFPGDQDNLPWIHKVPWQLHPDMCRKDGVLVQPPTKLPPPSELPPPSQLTSASGGISELEVAVYFIIAIAVSTALAVFGILHSRRASRAG